MTTLITLLLILQMAISPGRGTGALAIPPTVTPPSWDTTAGHSCNPVITTSTNPYTCTLTTSAGELMVISYFLSTNVPIFSVTVDGTPATVIVNQALAGSFGWQGTYYLANTTAGSHTVALTFSVMTSPPAFYVRTITGANTSSPIDGTPTGAVFTVGSGANFACPSFTTTSSNDLIVAWGMSSSTTNVSAGSGYTLFAGATLNSGNSGGAYESQSNAAAGNYAPNFANGNGMHQGCIGFGVKS